MRKNGDRNLHERFLPTTSCRLLDDVEVGENDIAEFRSEEITYVYAQRQVVSHDQSFAWRNGAPAFQGLWSIRRGAQPPTFILNEPNP